MTNRVPDVSATYSYVLNFEPQDRKIHVSEGYRDSYIILYSENMQFETEETMTPHIEHCNVVYTHREKHIVDDSDSNIMSISSENKEEAKLSEMEENCMAIFSYMSTFKLTGIASEHLI